MALYKTQQQAPDQSRSSEIDPDLEELEELESDLKNMAEKIIHYRRTLPGQLKNTFSSALSAQRPILPVLESGSAEPGPSGDGNSDPGVHDESNKGLSLAEEDQETTEKIQLLKKKISSNISAMPAVLKRMNECISMIDKLDSYKGIVHPAFKKKRTS